MALFERKPTVKVEAEEYERLTEAGNSLRQIKRDLEDVGYYILNQNGTNVDVRPMQREKLYRRILTYYIEEPLVGASIDMMPTYVFGRGLPKPESSNRKVQTALDEFWDDEDNRLAITSFQAQYQKAVELQLQANIFLAVFRDEGWGIRVGTIPHAEIKEIIPHPENAAKPLWYKREFVEEIYDFEQGYATPQHHRKKVVWYKHWKHEIPIVNGTPYKPEHRPEDNIFVEENAEIYHIRQGGTGEMRFGTPSIQRVLDWAKAHNEWMRSRVAVAKAAAQFAWERKLKAGSDPNKVMSIARSWAGGVRQPLATTSLPGEPGYRDPAHAPRFASMLTTNEGVEYNFRGNNPTAAGDAASDQKMFRSMISAGTRIPQHWLGDEGSANLATATAMNEPTIRMMEFFQELMEQVFRDLLDEHLEVRGLGEDQISTTPTITVSQVQEAARYEFLESLGAVDDTPGDLGMGSDSPVKIEGGIILDPMDSPEEAANRPVYKLTFPPILNRDVAAQMNMIIDAVTGLDPAGDNTDLTRWAFKEILKIMGEPEPDRIVDEIFPSHNLADQFGTNVDQGKEVPPGAPNAAGAGPADPALSPVGDMAAQPALTDPRTRPGAAPSPGLGNDMMGTQNGARMGASLMESQIRIDELQEFGRIMDAVERSVLNPSGSPKVDRLLDKIYVDLTA